MKIMSILKIAMTILSFLLCVLALVSCLPLESDSQTRIWKPNPGTSWQWQLTGESVDTSYNVAAYDVDGFDTSRDKVAEIHRKGAKAICYISVGSWENWHPDKNNFPDSVLGNKYDGPASGGLIYAR